MSKATLILGILVATLQLANHVSSQPVAPTFAFSFCRNTLFGNYTTNSTYEDNLKTVLSDLEVNASANRFHNSSAGTGASNVHAQYSCRGDVTSDFCSQCVQEASLKALNCSNAKGAIIWYDECTLRYMNQSMDGIPENHLVLTMKSRANLTDPNEFSGILNDTMTGLIEEAAQGTGFATAEKTLSDNSTAYFLADCSLDLTRGQCESCLTNALNETQTCCGEWPVALYSLAPSCRVMYNTIGTFYFSPNAPPSSPTTSATPSAPPPPLFETSSTPSPPDHVTVLQTPPPPTMSMSTGGSASIRASNSMKLTIITIVLVVLTLVLNA